MGKISLFVFEFEFYRSDYTFDKREEFEFSNEYSCHSIRKQSFLEKDPLHPSHSFQSYLGLQLRTCCQVIGKNVFDSKVDALDPSLSLQIKTLLLK